MTASRTVRRVLMTADTVGGVWTYAVGLIRALAPFGIEFDFATLGGPLSASQRADVEALPNVCGVHESAAKLEWMPDPWDDVQFSGQWLLQLEAETRPDLVHLNAGYAHAALPFRVPVFLVGHSCVLSWWQAVKGEPAPPEWNEYARRVRDGLHAAPVIAAPTDALLQSLLTHYGPFPNAKTLVLPNSGDPARFVCAEPENKEPFVFSAGRVWDEAKNVALLDAIAPELPFPVYVAGDEAEPGRTNANTKDAEFAFPSGAVRLGKLAPDDLAAYLKRAAIYASPARYEPFGLAILEAAFAGCALVLGDIPSLREVWGEAALYVPPHDTDLWHAVLDRLMNDDCARNELSRRAHARACRLYTAECMAKSYLNAYQTAVSQ